MKNSVKKILGAMACAILMLQLFSVNTFAQTGGDIRIAEGFQKVCENQRMALYVNRLNCYFAVADKSTSKVLYSNPLDADKDELASNRYKMELQAQFAFDYRGVKDKETSYLNSYTASVRREDFSVQEEKDGFTVLYTLSNLGLTLPFSVRLAEDHIAVSVDLSGLAGKETQINSLQILPYFGSGGSQTDGYNFVPDGSGAVINFNNKKSGAGGYRQWIYGNDPANEDTDATFVGEKISVPVFGCESDGGSFLGVIEEGAPQAAVLAYTSGHLTMYNNVYPSFCLIADNTLEVSSGARTAVFGTEYLTDSVSVKYYPLGEGQGGYAGMAAIYRDYLVKTNRLADRKQTAPYGMLMETYGAVRKKQSILGFPVTVTKKLTSFEDGLSMVKAMEEQGISNIRVEYNNWSKAGVTGKIDANPKPLSEIGGERGRKAFAEYLSKNGGDVYLNVSAMTFDNSSMGASPMLHGIKKLGNIQVEEFPVKWNILAPDSSRNARALLNYSKVDEMLNGLFRNFNKWGNRHVSFSDIGNRTYSDFSDKQQVFRGQSIDRVNTVMRANREAYDSLLLHNANAYSFEFAGYISKLPTESSGFSIVDASVPFLQMVLHGAVQYAAPPVNMSSNPTRAVLKAIETGSELSFAWIYENPEVLRNTPLDTLFASDYRLWLDFAAESYKKANAALKDVSGLRMTDHRRLQDGVFETVYENGTKTIVNYNDTAVTAGDGVTVKALDFVMVEGGAG